MLKGAIPLAVAYGRIAAMSVLLVLGPVGSALAWQRYLQIEGHVQWIAGQTLILATNASWIDSAIPWALWSIRIDLTRVPQNDYAVLRQGDLVTVTGLLSDDNSRLIGTSIERPR